MIAHVLRLKPPYVLAVLAGTLALSLADVRLFPPVMPGQALAEQELTADLLLKKCGDALGGKRTQERLSAFRMTGSRMHEGFLRRFSLMADQEAGFREDILHPSFAQANGSTADLGWQRLPNGLVLELPAQEMHLQQLWRIVLTRTWLEPERFGLKTGRPVYRAEEGEWRLPMFGPANLSFTLYFEARSWMLVRAVVVQQGAQLTLEFGNYRKVRGLLYPATINAGIRQGGVTDTAYYQIEDLEPTIRYGALPFQPPSFFPSELRFPDGVDSIALPIKLAPDSGQPLVSVAFPGEPPAYFLLDTGSDLTILDWAETSGRSLTPLEQVLVGDALSASQHPLLILPRLLLGEATLDRIPLIAMDLKNVSEQAGWPLAGLLGADFLTLGPMTLDFAKGTLTLHRASTFQPPAQSTMIPIDRLRRVLVSVARGDKVNQRPFQLNTGNSGCVSLAQDVAFRLGLEPPPNRRLETSLLRADKRIKGYLGRIEQLSIGPINMGSPIASFEKSSAPPANTSLEGGILGMGMLTRFRITLDLPHNQVWLEPLPGIEAPYPYDRSGLLLSLEGTLKITGKREGLTLDVVPGDRLLGVKLEDGTWTRKPSEIQRRLKFPVGTVMTLEILRAGQTFERVLTLEDWL